MSIDRNIYLGPVVVCRIETKVVEQRTGSACSKNAKHVVPKVTFDWPKFCPECGAPAVAKTEKHKAPRLDPLDDSSPRGFGMMPIYPDGEAFPDFEHTYVVNLIPSATRRPFHLDELCEYREFLRGDTRALDIAWLEKNNRKDLEHLRKHYGAENVRIEWAVLRWSS
jgi:hypothetical protein